MKPLRHQSPCMTHPTARRAHACNRFEAKHLSSSAPCRYSWYKALFTASMSAMMHRVLLFVAIACVCVSAADPSASYNVTVSPWVNHRVYAPLSLPVGSAVQFRWSGAHGVYLLPTDQCPETFPAGPSELFAAATANSVNNVLNVTLQNPGIYYFACQVGDHCIEDGQKLVVTVTNSTAGTVAGFTASTTATA